MGIIPQPAAEHRARREAAASSPGPPAAAAVQRLRGRLLTDALAGDGALFTREDTVEDGSRASPSAATGAAPESVPGRAEGMVLTRDARVVDQVARAARGKDQAWMTACSRNLMRPRACG